ncbi:methyl-accepting chemotaxis protein [Brevibacillus dissolubilis]|uniref:methyl-accepting chemotaxis protein n=1 Tax=Brevibacillus dissolubilis TaxID=1844116 RepID=UPI001116E359|nr:methyl-accepting chemotaxis protein [Brevibacillus dissolubilis]
MDSFMVKRMVIYLMGSFIQGLLLALPVLGYIIWSTEDISWLQVIIVLLLCGVGMILVGLFNFIKWAKPFKAIENHIHVLASGDLTAEPDREALGPLVRVAGPLDEMRDNWRGMINQINRANESLRQSVGHLVEHAAETENIAQHVTVSVQTTSNDVLTQMKATEESARAMEEMTIGIQRIASSSSLVSERSVYSTEQTNKGFEQLKQTVTQMDSITRTVENLASSITSLSQQSNEIGQIIEVITQITNQTNLLSLNASIEAARAGEHGKGFAVVASEVGNLARQSAESATKIADLVKRIQADTQQVLAAMNIGTKEVAVGTDMVEATGQIFRDILRTIQEVSAEVEEMSAASEQLAASSQQVSSSMDDVAHIARRTQQGSSGIAASIEQELSSIHIITASANQVNELADQLNSLVKKFKI